MIEKAGSVGVVQAHRGWRNLEGLCDGRIIENRLQERAYALVRHGINKPSQLSEHLLGITSRSGAEVGILELPLLAPADALHDQLGPVVIELDRAPHLHDIVISRARLEYAPMVRNPTQPPVLAGEPDAIYALPEGGVMVASGNGYRVAKRNLSASVKR